MMDAALSEVYAVGWPTAGPSPVKIGFTTVGVAQRLYALRAEGQTKAFARQVSQQPENLAVLWTGRGDRRLERALHVHFSEYRIRGEWFGLQPQSVPRLVDYAVASIREQPAANGDLPVGDRHEPSDFAMYKNWIDQGFSEQQALRMVAILARERWSCRTEDQ